MRVVYLDLISGISGDMFIGALLDMGVDLDALEAELKKLKLEGYHLHGSAQQRSSIAGVKFDVHIEGEHGHRAGEEGEQSEHGVDVSHAHSEHAHHGEHHHRHHHEHGHWHEESRDFKAIKRMIEASALSPWVKERAVAVFHRVAVAEGKIHGRAPEEVHFHEVGAVDSIVDIVGGCIALEMLGKPRVLSSPVVEGTGWVDCAHGRFPVPTTATLEILAQRGIGVTQCEEPHELVTPTGAALLAEFAETFAPMRDLKASKIGYGLGSREHRTRPNVLRAILAEAAGEEVRAMRDWEVDTIAVLETDLDDANPELLGHFCARAFAAGALDVFYAPIQMKKSRPGVLLTVLSPSEVQEDMMELMLRETTAFGVRVHQTERRKLPREVMAVHTAYGTVRVKLGKLNGQVIHATPEYDSCKRLAEEQNLPLKEIYQAANRALSEHRM